MILKKKTTQMNETIALESKNRNIQSKLNKSEHRSVHKHTIFVISVNVNSTIMKYFFKYRTYPIR